MAPALLAVDSDPAALGDVERELRNRYTSSYDVRCTTSPAEALEILERLSEVGEEVALVLAAQWLSGTTGSELLARARRLHPQAKRGRLVPWSVLHTGLGAVFGVAVLAAPAQSQTRNLKHPIDWTKRALVATGSDSICGAAGGGA